MRRAAKLWIRQIAIIVTAAPVVGYLTLRFTILPFANYFEREYPHDGQNSLAAFAAALGLAVVAGGLTIAALFIWTLWRSDRIERDELEKLTEVADEGGQMKGWVAVLAVMVGVSAAAWAADKPFDPGADPANDLQAAEQRAQAEHKNILMDVGGNWCGWCLVLEKTIHGDAELEALLENNYVVLHVNFSKENENTKFLRKYPQPEGYPSWYVLSPQGKLLKAETNTSELEATHKLDQGYNKDAIRKFLEKHAPKAASQPVA